MLFSNRQFAGLIGIACIFGATFAPPEVGQNFVLGAVLFTLVFLFWG